MNFFRSESTASRTNSTRKDLLLIFGLCVCGIPLASGLGLLIGIMTSDATFRNCVTDSSCLYNLSASNRNESVICDDSKNNTQTTTVTAQCQDKASTTLDATVAWTAGIYGTYLLLFIIGLILKVIRNTAENAGRPRSSDNAPLVSDYGTNTISNSPA